MELSRRNSKFPSLSFFPFVFLFLCRTGSVYIVWFEGNCSGAGDLPIFRRFWTFGWFEGIYCGSALSLSNGGNSVDDYCMEKIEDNVFIVRLAASNRTLLGNGDLRTLSLQMGFASQALVDAHTSARPSRDIFGALK